LPDMNTSIVITSPPISRLSPRQIEIVTLLLDGSNNKQVASILSIKCSTVRTQIKRACKSTGAKNRTQLIVMFAFQKALENEHG